MTAEYYRIISLFLSAVLILLSVTGCASTPDNTQVEAAIRVSLAKEQNPPELDFSAMEVPIRFSGKANAVLWTEDKSIQRNYVLEYDRESREFTVTDYTTSVLGEDGSYSLQQPAPLTAYAGRFDFTDNPDERVMLIYIGEDDGTTDIKKRFEEQKLSGFTADELASFGECDLGAIDEDSMSWSHNILVLMIPKYEGTVLSVTEVVARADDIATGDEVARFDDGEPVYLRFDWDGWYDIQIIFGGVPESYIRGYEGVLENLRKNDTLIY